MGTGFMFYVVGTCSMFYFVGTLENLSRGEKGSVSKKSERDTV